MRKLTLIIGMYCAFISAQTMAESVILNPYQVLNVQTGQLDKTQIMISNGKITQIGSNLKKNSTIEFKKDLLKFLKIRRIIKL